MARREPIGAPDIPKRTLEHRFLESGKSKFISIPDEGGLDLLDLRGDVKVLRGELFEREREFGRSDVHLGEILQLLPVMTEFVSKDIGSGRAMSEGRLEHHVVPELSVSIGSLIVRECLERLFPQCHRLLAVSFVELNQRELMVGIQGEERGGCGFLQERLGFLSSSVEGKDPLGKGFQSQLLRIFKGFLGQFRITGALIMEPLLLRGAERVPSRGQRGE